MLHEMMSMIEVAIGNDMFVILNNKGNTILFSPPAAKSNYGVNSGDINLFILCSIRPCNTSTNSCLTKSHQKNYTLYIYTREKNK